MGQRDANSLQQTMGFRNNFPQAKTGPGCPLFDSLGGGGTELPTFSVLMANA